MESRKVIKYITLNALIAAVYVVLSVILGPLSFGTNGLFEVRLSEMLMALCFISPFYFPGLIIGCFVSNIFSGMPIDMLIGTLQTVIACFIMYYLRKVKHVSIILASITCGVMIGLELYFLGFAGELGLLIMLTIFVSEVVILELGYLLFYLLDKIPAVSKLLNDVEKP